MDHNHEKPLLSVIVPVHGTEAYLPACLDSLVPWLDGSVEVLVVDDASPDGSPAIIDAYASRHPGIEAIHLSDNVHLGPARNIGIERARGRYIAFLDSDDYAAGRGFLDLAATLERTGSDVAVGRVVQRNDYVDGSHELGPYQPGRMRRDTVLATSLACCPALAFIPSCWSMVMRRDLLVERDIRFRRPFQEDHDFGLELLLKATSVDVLATIDVVVHRRRSVVAAGPASITQQPWDERRTAMIVDHMQRVAELLDSDAARAADQATNLISVRWTHYATLMVREILPAVLSRLDASPRPGEAAADDTLAALAAIASRFEALGARLGDRADGHHPRHLLSLAIRLLCARHDELLRQLLRDGRLHLGDLLAAVPPGSADEDLDVAVQDALAAGVVELDAGSAWAPLAIPHHVERVILHIGATKTASTSFQNFMEANRDALAWAGVCYPRAGVVREQGRRTERTAGHQQLLHDAIRGRDPAPILACYRELSAAPQARVVVLSAENLFHLATLAQIRQIRAILGNTPVTVLAGLRHPESWIRSWYGEAVSGGNLRECRAFDAFVEHSLSAGLLRYDRVLEPWAEVFGAENIRLVGFETATGEQDMVPRLCAAAGLPEIPGRPGTARTTSNVTRLSVSQIEAIRMINMLPELQGNAYKAVVERIVRRFMDQAAPAAPQRRFEPRIKAQIDSQLADMAPGLRRFSGGEALIGNWRATLPAEPGGEAGDVLLAADVECAMREYRHAVFAHMHDRQEAGPAAAGESQGARGLRLLQKFASRPYAFLADARSPRVAQLKVLVDERTPLGRFNARLARQIGTWLISRELRKRRANAVLKT